MKVGAIGDSISVRLGATRRRTCGRAAEAQTAAPKSHALVAVDPPARTDTLLVIRSRPLATFLAHLIATDQQLPQTRERRRAEPEQAIAAYAALVTAPRGRVLQDI
jgi:hypothetical protein